MKHIKNFDGYINESKTNLYQETTNEIDEVVKQLVNGGSKEEDLHYLLFDTPFLINPDSKNESYKKQIGVVLFVKLLSYSHNVNGNENVGYQLTPWIACRISLNTNDNLKEILNWVKDKIESSTKLKLFMDEDATYMHWKEDSHNDDYTEYTCYINPSYPEGWWENHTLE